MNVTRKAWIAGGLIASMVFGGLVDATDENPLVTLGNGCCRTAVSPTAEPLPDIPPVALPAALPAEPASAAR